MNIEQIQEQIEKNRRTVSFDSYDMSVRQLIDMVMAGEVDVAPEYQRHFKWDEVRQSQLIESLFLGIPVPSVFMATNRDSSWEVIDGVQRITTLVNFIGDEESIKKINPKCEVLEIQGLEKLDALNGVKFSELPRSLQLMFYNRIVKVTVLNDRSDFEVRYDLFERLNTGGITLHPQEIRNCIFVGEFNDFLKECSSSESFKKSVKMTKNAERSGSLEELALRFFAYYESSDIFDHGVKDFLNTYMSKKTGSFKNKRELSDLFDKTFSTIQRCLPEGIVRANRKNVTSTVLFEAISVGTARAIEAGAKITPKKMQQLLDDADLREYTTGATNSKKMLFQRINLVKDSLTR